MRVEKNGFKQTEIGLIPEDWEVVRLGEVVEFSRKPRSLWIREDDEIPFIPMELIPDSGKYANWLIRKYSEISSGSFIFKDDIIVAKITPSFENGKQALLTNLPMDFGYATTEVWAFHPENENIIREYIFEYLRIPKIRKDLASKMEGTTGRQRVPRNALENLLIPLLPLKEQRKIAKVLDTIQQAIELQDSIIEQAKSLKKSLMKKLFTEGLYGEEQKETEIGLIPKSWEVVKLGEVVDVKGGKRLPKGHKLVDKNTGYPYIRVTDFKDMGVDLKKVKFLLPETYEKIKKYTISSNDVYISIAGTPGIVGIIPTELNNSNLTENAAKLVLKNKDIEKWFLAYLLSSFIGQKQIKRAVHKANQPKLALARIKQFLIPLPPLEEQKQIAHILSTVDKKIEIEQRKKQLLKELFKTMLHKLMRGEIRLKEVEI